MGARDKGRTELAVACVVSNHFEYRRKRCIVPETSRMKHQTDNTTADQQVSSIGAS